MLSGKLNLCERMRRMTMLEEMVKGENAMHHA